MNIEIIRANGDLKREVWDFSLDVSYGSPCIYFDDYSFQTKESTRHRKWLKQTHWTRLMRRDNNIDNPPLPSDVKAEMLSRYQESILTLPIRS